MLDHDTDSYYKISRAFAGEQPAGNLTRNHVLDNITLYWLTGSGASAARLYWEGGHATAHAAGQAPPELTLPVAFTTFPGEIFRAPRSWVEKIYPTSATSTRPNVAATSPPGKSHNSFPKKSAPASGRSASRPRGRHTQREEGQFA